MRRGVSPEPMRADPPGLFPVQMRHRRHSSEPPVPRTSFVGREREVGVVHALLGRGDVRLVTLTGPGGVGKTRIAIRAISSDPHRAEFIDLADVQQPDLVLPTIAAALGVHPTGSPVLESLRAELRDDDHLLVLDNFEQVLPAASTVAALLDACPGVKLLVTSRAVLGVPGERVVGIRPFPLPVLRRPMTEAQAAGFDVCRLFVDRAQALDPEFTLTGANAETVARICERLDGLPLAIELAAAWIPVLSPGALLAQLEDRLSLLSGELLGVPQRQRTLRDTIAWSYGLLNPSSQALFRRLAIFIGGGTLDAIQEVCGDGSLDILPELRALIANSLVQRAESPGDASRYIMLETIREFGVELLEASGEAPAIRQRHAAYVLALAERVEAKLNTVERDAWLDRLEAEQGNVHNALGWALEREDAEFALALAGSLLPFWQFRFHSGVGRDWVRRSLQLAKDASAPVMRKALFCAGTLAYMHGEQAEAEALFADAFARYQEAGDPVMTGRIELALGRLAWDQGDLDAARTWFDSAKRRFDGCRDEAGLTHSLHSLGLVAFTDGDYRLAATLLREALALWRSLGFTWELACCIPGHLADVARAEGHLAEAMTLYQECLRLNWERQDLENVAWSLAGLALVAITGEQVDLAARLMVLAVQFRARTGAPLTPHIDRDHHLAVRTVVARVGEERFAAMQAALGDAEPTVEIATALAMTPPAVAAHTPAINGPGLTQRELDVLRLMASGKSNQDIADILFVSRGTVKVHVTHILAKLEVTSRWAATDYARRHGLA